MPEDFHGGGVGQVVSGEWAEGFATGMDGEKRLEDAQGNRTRREGRMKKTWIWMAAAGLAGLVAAGCVSTPESRIEKNRAFFDALPADRQARIRRGQTDVGFTAEETRLALGEPTRIYERRDAAGEAEIWEYCSEERRYERQRVEWVDGRANGRGAVSGYVNVLQTGETVETRVELRGGAVTAVDRRADRRGGAR